MKLLINKRIIFHEDKSTIELLDNTAEPVMLTLTLSRVLSLLVKNNNLLLTREFLLSHAWDEYGKTSSHSNLNNYISMIRKIFSAFGESDIIVTVPRQGFMFAAVEVNTITSESLQNQDTAEVPMPVAVAKAKIKWGLTTPVLVLIMLGLVSAYLLMGRYQPVSHSAIGKVEQCAVVVLNTSHYVKHADDELEKVKSLVVASNFNCTIPATLYYFNTQMLTSRTGPVKSISFLSYCPTSSLDGIEAQCENAHHIVK
ncbi:winged helix-turn-helix domain-containing protein [Serratia marcescens]|uniref:winged helix-turn-helix domain-containing protein n=1 Tax=Serratia marcescens TaxID=615 RepID=UPI0015D87F6A|nr:winged helix-turn-helix domain-containing protein [Serratia marcescens]QLJ67569.1 winged helix-turn-helix domain-containing protein [Serratia marcescens]